MTPRRAKRLVCLPLVIALSGTLSACRRESETPDAKMNAAYAALPSRPLIPRLSGFPYVPAPRLSRGAETTQELELKTAAYEVLAAPRKTKSFAASALIVGKLTEAEGSLREQLKRDPNRADSWNDLAATLYEAGQKQSDPGTLAASLAAADRAIVLSPSSTEAVFNRGAILDALSLRAAAANYKGWNSAMGAGVCRTHYRDRANNAVSGFQAVCRQLRQGGYQVSFPSAS